MQPGGAYPVAAPTNTLAIISLVAGIASFVFVPVIGGIVAVVTGHIARGQIKRTGESGDGLALAGLIVGYIHLALTLIVIVIIVVAVIVGFGIFAASQGR
jgi:hypothetical protein